MRAWLWVSGPARATMWREARLARTLRRDLYVARLVWLELIAIGILSAWSMLEAPPLSLDYFGWGAVTCACTGALTWLSYTSQMIGEDLAQLRPPVLPRALLRRARRR